MDIGYTHIISVTYIKKRNINTCNDILYKCMNIMYIIFVHSIYETAYVFRYEHNT